MMLCVSLAICLAATFEVDKAIPNIVEVEGMKGLQEIAGKGKPLVLMVYAPWCDHSKKAGKLLKKTAPKIEKFVTLGKVNGEFYGDVPMSLGTSAYPQILYFEKGSAAPSGQYSGPLTEEDFENFIFDKIGTENSKKQEKIHIAILTEQTFDRAVTFPGRTSFIQFLTRESKKAREVASWYESIASAFKSDEKVLIGAADMGSTPGLNEKYNLKAGESPHFLLFKPDGSVLTFSDTPTPKSVMNFINKHAATSRGLDGSLNDNAGLLNSVHVLVAGKASSVLALELGLTEALKKPEEAKLYTKILPKVIAKGEAWVDTEIKRLQKMIANGDVTGPKKDTFTMRVNILRSLKK
eukprot:TRINITY_DN10552_c0_g1_i2.p1 TRINITY_DN10552_c0_g1~~TRINITY_DN10552_c0_g1_i2.p1  ORF type:complete len:352 (+),score=53.87 TRINITY_DN10552_c0_g1_i2:47-1102(+)